MEVALRRHRKLRFSYLRPIMSTEEIGRSVVKMLVDAGFTAYFAGGWVRDHLLGIPCSDIDIATDAPPTAVMKLFSKTVPVGLAFGSVIVVEEGIPFEVTTFRSESGYVDGRHPETVTFSTPEADAKRRSFTINGMFYDPLADEVIDLVGGKDDLKAKLIRAIGNPQERFTEDKLRMIRAARFSARLGFPIEPATRQAIKDHATELFPAVAVERVWQEFQKIGNTPQFGPFLEEMHSLGLLKEIFPELKGDFPTWVPYPEDTPTVLQVMQLFRKLPPANRLAICDRLKLSGQEKTWVSEQAQLQALLENPDATAPEWVHFYALKDAPLYLTIEACHQGKDFLIKHNTQQQALRPHIQRAQKRQPLVTARHLAALGIKPGPQMGKLLKEAEILAIESDLDTADQVLAVLKTSLHTHE